MAVTTYETMTLPEEGTQGVSVTFVDEVGDAVTPDSASWSLYDRPYDPTDDPVVINSRTAVAISSPSSTETIVLEGDDLAFLSTEEGTLAHRVLIVDYQYDNTYDSQLQHFFTVERIAEAALGEGPRIGPSGVKQIISTSNNPTPFIEAAFAIVTDRLTGKGLSEAVLKEIERYLAAHLMASTLNRQSQRKQVGDASETYGMLGKALESTTYGQTVLLLDSSGALKNAGKRETAFDTLMFLPDD